MWTTPKLINKFAELLDRYTGVIRNGSFTFQVHFRNNKIEKIEVDGKEHFGRNAN